ncbi:MAG: family 31 glucosidase, partial [Lachnospiraceae bacterium]|nr:family 31 glucosidase [Lachnospiraceae bacterium]
MIFYEENGALIAKRQGETLRIEGWGENSLRVRATMQTDFTENDWALTEAVPASAAVVTIGREEDGNPCAEIVNGRVKATVNFAGVLSFYRDDALILREYYRSYGGTLSRESRCLKVVNREWKGVPGGSEYKLKVLFESNDGEKIYGMGQYQQPYLNLKGTMLELAQRNSQISVPFMVSSLGYGMLWNNPAVGSVTFGKNITEWTARATKQMDYWIAAGDGPKDLLVKYTAVTGRAPMFPESLMGLW